MLQTLLKVHRQELSYGLYNLHESFQVFLPQEHMLLTSCDHLEGIILSLVSVYFPVIFKQSWIQQSVD